MFGMPRSGTTWLGKIFDSHPMTLYRHEPDTWRSIEGVPLFPEPGSVNRYRKTIAEYVATVGAMRSERVCAKQPIFPKDYLSGLEFAAYKATAALSKAAGRAGLDLPVFGAPCGDGERGVRLAWKSIESLGRLGLLLECLPDARAVQIIRHPCGYVSSVLRGEAAQRFTHGGAAEDFGIFEMLCGTTQAQRRGLTLEDLKMMGPAERLAWRWVLYNEKAWEEAQQSSRCLLVNYEELCFDPQGVARRIFQFCGLPWDSQTEAFLGESTSSSKDDYYSVFKDPLKSAWRWAEVLEASNVQHVMAVAGNSQLAGPYFESLVWNNATRRGDPEPAAGNDAACPTVNGSRA